MRLIIFVHVIYDIIYMYISYIYLRIKMVAVAKFMWNPLFKLLMILLIFNAINVYYIGK